MIHINSFVRRQMPEPGMRPSTQYSYFTGTDEDLLERVSRNMADGNFRSGYRDGVILVPVDASGFFSSVVTLQEGDKLVGEFVPRREGETPRKTLRTVRLAPQPAQRVEIVLYASPVLAEGGDNELPADGVGNWEIISINAFPTDEILPIHPEVLMHNHFGSDGGTATGMSDSEFVEALRESFEAWKDKAQGTVGE